MIGFEDLVKLSERLADSDPEQELTELGIDPDAVLRVAEDAGRKAVALLTGGVAHPSEILSALYAAGFTMGVQVAQVYLAAAETETA